MPRGSKGCERKEDGVCSQSMLGSMELATLLKHSP
jgi:hypothetical protein